MMLDLTGAWRVARADRKGALPARVPGRVHTDLLAAGRIPDPFYRDNESALQWIGETDWVYTRTCTVSPALLAHDRVLLRCDGLDTLATVLVNGREVGRADNMYRTWEFDVRAALIAGKNTIAIRFDSAMRYIA